MSNKTIAIEYNTQFIEAIHPLTTNDLEISSDDLDTVSDAINKFNETTDIRIKKDILDVLEDMGVIPNVK